MIALGKKLFGDDKIEFKLLPMEELNTFDEKFDVVFSSLAFHYVEDFDKLIKDIAGHMNKGGILLFSQEHPIVTSCTIADKNKTKLEMDGKLYYLFSDYNNEGERSKDWNVSGVIKYHRTFKTTINTLVKNNFEIVCIDESSPRPEAVEKVEKYKYQKDRPFFLFVKAKLR